MAATKRILVLTESYYPNRGGMAQSCDRIVAGLRQPGLQADILHFTGRGPAWQVRQEQGGSYIACPPELNESHTLNRTWNWLERQAENQQYDLLLAFGGHLPMLAAPIYAQWLALPFLLLLRGNDFDASIFSPKRQPILEKAVRQAACVASVSADKVRKIERAFPGANATFIANGIDLAEWAPLPSDLARATALRTEHLPSGKFMLGMIGQLKAKKGFDFLLQAIDRAHATEKIHLLVVGDLPEPSQKLLESSGLSWTALPFMDRYELLGVYPACDAVALPSFYDGMPNVLLEALGLGIPALAADVDGIHDVMHAAKVGWLFHPGDLPGCAKAIRAMLATSPSDLQAVGQRGQSHIAQNFTVQLETAAYSQTIQAICSTPHTINR